ncbi:hypothetical protein D3C75_1116610 [compost metagenome]
MNPPIIDHHKLWVVKTEAGVLIEIAAIGGKGVVERAAARGLKVREETIAFHPLYREFVVACDVIDKKAVADEITDVIYQDMADHP